MNNVFSPFCFSFFIVFLLFKTTMNIFTLISFHATILRPCFSINFEILLVNRICKSVSFLIFFSFLYSCKSIFLKPIRQFQYSPSWQYGYYHKTGVGIIANVLSGNAIGTGAETVSSIKIGETLGIEHIGNQ